MNALAGFELDVLKQDFFIGHCRIAWNRNAQQGANISQVRPQFSIFCLPASIEEVLEVSAKESFGLAENIIGTSN